MKEKCIYQGDSIQLMEAEISIHQKTLKKEVARHPGGVGIVCIKDNQILLVRQYRYAIDQVTLEIPAGKKHKDETYKQCAIREMNEETGYDCKEWIPLHYFMTTPGFCDEKLWLYQAIDPFPSATPLEADEDEDIEVCWMSLEEACEKIKNEEIIDAATIVAIYTMMLERK